MVVDAPIASATERMVTACTPPLRMSVRTADSMALRRRCSSRSRNWVWRAGGVAAPSWGLGVRAVKGASPVGRVWARSPGKHTASNAPRPPVAPPGSGRCRAADQVVEGAQRGRGARPRGNDDLLVRHRGAVTGGEHAWYIGVALGVHHDLAELRQLH